MSIETLEKEVPLLAYLQIGRTIAETYGDQESLDDTISALDQICQSRSSGVLSTKLMPLIDSLLDLYSDLVQDKSPEAIDNQMFIAEKIHLATNEYFYSDIEVVEYSK